MMRLPGGRGDPSAREANADGRTVVAVCLRHYLPGFKTGGPVRTIANLVEHLGDELDFRVVTADRDTGDLEPYADITPDSWQQVGKARVHYVSPANQTLTGIVRVLRGIDYDVLYLNSFFDARFTILPLLARRFGMLRRGRVIVAPRGEFAASALGIRARKKRMYRLIARLTGLYEGVTWHASSEFEKADIGRRMGERAARDTCVAVNLPKRIDLQAVDAWHPRRQDEPLRVVFLGRIAPMKNLEYALRVVAACGFPLSFDIYGMVDDQGYWETCRDLIARLPPHVRATYHGSLPPDQVGTVLAAHDVMLLPTLGENYGHVIAESLTQGTPVVISDRTPWRDLRAVQAGWDLPLGDSVAPFVAALAEVAVMEPQRSLEMRRRAIDYGLSRLRNPEALESNRHLFGAGVPKVRSRPCGGVSSGVRVVREFPV